MVRYCYFYVKSFSVTCSIIHVELTELTYTLAARNDQGQNDEFSLMLHLISV